MPLNFFLNKGLLMFNALNFFTLLMILHYSLTILNINANALSLIFFINANTLVGTMGWGEFLKCSAAVHNTLFVFVYLGAYTYTNHGELSIIECISYKLMYQSNLLPTYFISIGRYPEDHSIVGDFMYDLKDQRLFNASDISTTRYASWVKIYIILFRTYISIYNFIVIF